MPLASTVAGSRAPNERGAQDRLIRLAYPRPVALAWARATTVDEPTQRMRRLTEVTETTTRLLAAWAVADLLGHGPLPSSLREFEPRLRRPPDGVWYQFARDAAFEAERAAAAAGMRPFTPELAEWWRSASSEGSTERALNEAVRLRNAFAHGASPDTRAAAQRADELERLLRDVLASLSWAAGYRIARVMSARPDTNGRFTGMVSLYVGSDDVPWSASSAWQGWLREGALYLLAADARRALPLDPLLAVGPIQDDHPEQLLLWQRLGRSGGIALRDGRTDHTAWHNEHVDGAPNDAPTWPCLFHENAPTMRERFARVAIATEDRALVFAAPTPPSVATAGPQPASGSPLGHAGTAPSAGGRDTLLAAAAAALVALVLLGIFAFFTPLRPEPGAPDRTAAEASAAEATTLGEAPAGASDPELAMAAYRAFRAEQQQLQRRLVDQTQRPDDLDALAAHWAPRCAPCWWYADAVPSARVLRDIYNRNRRYRTDITIDHLEHLVTNAHGVWLLAEERLLDARADHRAWRSHQRVVRMVEQDGRYVIGGEVLAQHVGRWRETYGLNHEVLPLVVAAQGVCPTRVDTATGQEWWIPEQPYWSAAERDALIVRLNTPQTSMAPTDDPTENCAATGTFAWRLPTRAELQRFAQHRREADPTLQPIDAVWATEAGARVPVDLAAPSAPPFAAEGRHRLWLVRFCATGESWSAEASACVEDE